MAGRNFDDVTPLSSAALLRAVADIGTLPVSYVDAAQCCRFVNKAYEARFGLTREAVVGRHVREALGEAAYAAARPHIEAALAGRAASYAHAVPVAGGGTRIVPVTLSPHTDGDGAVCGYVATVGDLVDGQALDPAPGEHAGHEREARLRAILESAVDGIIAIDEAGAIQSFNPAAERLFGYMEAEVVGRNVSMLMPPPYRDEHDGYLRAYRTTGQARIIGVGREVEARRKDGEVFPIHLSVGVARLGARRIFTGIIHDLTERKRLEGQLAHAQKMEAVGRLAGGVAHDFNNVLQTILGRCQAASRQLPPRHALRRQIAEIQKAGRRAASLTRQLLAVSRTQVLNPRVVDLNGVVRDTARMLRPLIGEDVAFRMELDPDLAPVRVDPDQMLQVVLNLVVNARDAMPRGGELVIQTRTVEAAEGRGRPAVLLAVRDTGTGMDDETRTRIFEPYFTTKGEKGTGLGLSTVYGIVEQSGGALTVESRLGAGSTFSIVLPVAEGRLEAAPAPRPARSAGPSSARVLLVEDDRAARRALEELLQEEGYTVVTAATGAEAERLWREGSRTIDVVVTDAVMPRMSGPELVQRLRSANADVKVIFMSGHTPETVLQHGGVTGTAFLQKPFEFEDLLAHIQQLVGRSGRADRHRRRRPRG